MSRQLQPQSQWDQSGNKSQSQQLLREDHSLNVRKQITISMLQLEAYYVKSITLAAVDTTKTLAAITKIFTEESTLCGRSLILIL